MTQDLRCGSYSICPLCDEHIKWPEPPPAPPGVFYNPEAMVLALSAEHEATLAEHVRMHTAEVMLR